MEEIKITENGESEVQVTTIGEVTGSDTDGNAVKQNFSEDALKAIAENTTEEILVDADHESEVGGSTEAKGWLSNLKFVDGKGLFGTIKWTDIGRKLIENRVFRWLSPSWILNKASEPIRMTSCALTNRPAQFGRIAPIINSEPENLDKGITDMTKEEIIDLIKQTVAEMKAVEEVAEVKEEIAEEIKEEVETASVETPVETAPVETAPVETAPVENGCGTKTEEVKNAEAPIEEPKEELIQEEVLLNSAPKTIAVASEPTWKSLKGADFISYIESGKYKADL